MNHMTRRQLFSTPAMLALMTALPIAVALPSCSALTTIAANLPQYAQDVQNIGTVFGNVASVVGSIAGVPQAVIAQVQGWIVQAQTIAGQVVSAVSSGTTPTSLVTDLDSVVQSLATALPSGIGGIVGTAVQLAATLLPSILAAAGVKMAQAPRATAPTGYTESEARQILAALASPS
jgi:hypothetical protein